MGRYVAERLREVVAAGDDAILTHYDSADGYLPLLIRHTGLVERPLHVEFVFFYLFFCCHGAKLQKFLYLCKRIMDFKIIHIDETDSTNRWLRSFYSKESGNLGNPVQSTGEIIPKFLNSLEKKESLVVVAEFQTAGKGCGSNSWESEKGKNLTFSLLIHPEDIPASRQFVVSMAMANSIAKVVSMYVKDVSIKWPNDIYVGDRKICGMLIENTLQGSTIKDSIIGVGVNVNQLRFVSDAPNPVSLANLTGKLYDKEMLLQQLLEAFDAEWSDLEGVRMRYLPQLYRRTGFHRYRDELSEFLAELVTVEDDGHLVLRNIDGYAHRYAFKEVTFII